MTNEEFFEMTDVLGRVRADPERLRFVKFFVLSAAAYCNDEQWGWFCAYSLLKQDDPKVQALREAALKGAANPQPVDLASTKRVILTHRRPFFPP